MKTQDDIEYVPRIDFTKGVIDDVTIHYATLSSLRCLGVIDL